MFYSDKDLQAPWIGYPPDWEDDDEEEMEYDEDFEYESRRDMELEEEIDELNQKENGDVELR